jgi:ribosomal protein L16 Arg81 hydroxylase
MPSKIRTKQTTAKRTSLPKQTRKRPDAPSADRELAALLAPMSVETFLRDYWQKKPLHLAGGRAKLKALIAGGYSRRDLLKGTAIAAVRQVPGYRVIAHQTAGFDHRGAQSKAVDIEPAAIAASFARGCNVQVAFPWDARVMTLLSHLKTQLGCVGEAALNVTLSPAGFGWPPHIDNAEAFFVQCEGHKRILISDAPVVAWPRGTVTFDSLGEVASYEFDADEADRVDRIDIAKLREITLAPGDVFYCPPGVVHGTKAVDETLTLLFAFKPPVALDVIHRTLRAQLVADVNWRTMPPARMSPTGELSPDVHAYFAARLAELRDAIGELTPEALATQLYQAVAFAGAGVQMPMQAARPLAREIRKTDRFRIGRLAPLTWAHGTADGAPAFFIFSGDRELGVGGDWMTFLETLVQRDEVRAGDAMRWGSTQPYPWAEVQEMFVALVQNGIVDLVS